MLGTRIRRPSASLVVSMVALFVALGGTAGAVATQAVPLAKRALVADNAKKLGGQSLAQLTAKTTQAVTAAASAPGPASTAASLVSTKSVPFTLGPGGNQVISATCDAGAKAVGGGFSNPTAALVLSAGGFPTADGAGWTEDLVNVSSSTTGAGTVVVMCMR